MLLYLYNSIMKSTPRSIYFNQEHFEKTLNERLGITLFSEVGICTALCNLETYFIATHPDKGHEDFIDYVNDKLNHDLDNFVDFIYVLQHLIIEDTSKYQKIIMNNIKAKSELQGIIDEKKEVIIKFGNHVIKFFQHKDELGEIKYGFFEPNGGTVYNLDIDALFEKINSAKNSYQQNNEEVFVVDAQTRLHGYLTPLTEADSLTPEDFVKGKENIRMLFKLVLQKNLTKEDTGTIEQICMVYKGDKHISFLLANFLKQTGHQSLTELATKISDIQGNPMAFRIGNYQIYLMRKEFIETLKNTQNINIDLSEKNIYPNYFTIITKVLFGKKIESLNLSENFLGNEGMFSLVPLVVMSGTKIVNIAGNNIDQEGAANISNMLGSGSRVKELDLAGNPIGDKGIMELGKALLFNKSLEKINLYNTSITDEGAKELLFILKNNKTITEINLSGNDISDELKKEIYAKMKPTADVKVDTITQVFSKTIALV